jgi:hypothetical protein
MSYCDQWIHLRGAPRGDETCDERDRGKSAGNDRERVEVPGFYAEEHAAQQIGGANGTNDAKAHAETDETRSFRKDQSQNIATLRSQGHAHADLPRALAN